MWIHICIQHPQCQSEGVVNRCGLVHCGTSSACILYLPSSRKYMKYEHLRPQDGYMAADEFFIYKFSREQAGLSGLAFDEGQFGVFGYVTAVSPRAPLKPCPHRIDPPMCTHTHVLDLVALDCASIEPVWCKFHCWGRSAC